LISDDGHGWLWLGSQRGIFKVGQSALDDVIAGRADRVQSIRYTAREGLPNLLAARAEPSEALRSRDGRLWFPMGTTLAIVNPDSALDLPAASPVRVTQIKIDGRPWAAVRTPMPPARDVLSLAAGPLDARVPPTHRKLEFEFACLSFSSRENVNFRYRLAGFDEGWIEAGTQPSAAYPRLPAGNYRFEVMACNSSGRWSEAPAVVAFTVAPFVWQTWWFQAAVVVGFTVAVIWTVRIVSYRRLHVRVKTLEQQAAVERERARIARDIHDDVGNRLTRILLLSGLAERDQADAAKATEHLRQITASATEVTESLDEIVWAVNPRNDTLVHLIDYIGSFTVEFLRTAGIQAEIDLPDRPPEHAVSADVRHNLFLGIKEAINNVVRHAGATEVKVRVVIVGDEMHVTVADNGRGFAAAPDNATADGLRNMHARLAEIGGRCEIESAPGAGTRVTFVFRWFR
jgi:signal transduction histidine kinase